MDNKSNQVTLEEATLSILQKIKERTNKVFADKWKGKTDMVLEIAIPVIILHSFDLPEKLPGKYKSFENVILREYKDLIDEMETLTGEGALSFMEQGLSERQAIAETKVQVFQALGKEIPSNLAIDIMHLVNS